MGDWVNFAVIAGGAAATLTGLLFVAASIRLMQPDSPVGMRLRAAQTLTLLTSVVIMALALVVPGQSERVLGVELVAIAAVTGTALILLDVRADRDASAPEMERALRVSSPNVLVALGLAVAGIALAVGWAGGLYVLAAVVVAALGAGMVNSWLFLMRPDLRRAHERAVSPSARPDDPR